MNKEKREKLEAKGWKSVTVTEFLGLTPDEEKAIELRLKQNHINSSIIKL